MLRGTGGRRLLPREISTRPHPSYHIRSSLCRRTRHDRSNRRLRHPKSCALVGCRDHTFPRWLRCRRRVRERCSRPRLERIHRSATRCRRGPRGRSGWRFRRNRGVCERLRRPRTRKRSAARSIFVTSGTRSSWASVPTPCAASRGDGSWSISSRASRCRRSFTSWRPGGSATRSVRRISPRTLFFAPEGCSAS